MTWARKFSPSRFQNFAKRPFALCCRSVPRIINCRGCRGFSLNLPRICQYRRDSEILTKPLKLDRPKCEMKGKTRFLNPRLTKLSNENNCSCKTKKCRERKKYLFPFQKRSKSGIQNIAGGSDEKYRALKRTSSSLRVYIHYRNTLQHVFPKQCKALLTDRSKSDLTWRYKRVANVRAR